jgi:hypothetical protein
VVGRMVRSSLLCILETLLWDVRSFIYCSSQWGTFCLIVS